LYDPYEEPNYNPGGGPMPQQPRGFQIPQINMPNMPNVNFEMPNVQGPSIDFKKFMPIIIVLIIVLIIGGIIFFVLSMQQALTFNLVDGDGKSLEGRLTFYTKDSKPIQITPSGSSTSFNVTLWPGEYKYSATKDGYKPITKKPLIVPNTSGDTIKVELERDVDVTLEIKEFDSTEIYDGQVLTGKLNVQLGSGEINFSDINAVAKAPLEVTLVPLGTNTIGLGSIYVDFNVRVKNGSKITTPTPATISFRIKGTKITSEVKNLSILPSVLATELSGNATKALANENLVAGRRDEMPKITIKNGNKNFQLKNVHVEIVPNAGSEQNLSWFKFNQGIVGKEYSVDIPLIEPEDSYDLLLYVQPPSTAKQADLFDGYLLIDSYSIKGDVRSTMRYVVKTALEINVVASGTFNASSTCPKDSAMCEQVILGSGTFLENKGNTKIDEISLWIDVSDPNSSTNLTSCATWIDLKTKTIASLEPSTDTTGKNKKPINMIITPVRDSGEENTNCMLRWSYKDPVDGDKLIPGEQIFTIKKNIQN